MKNRDPDIAGDLSIYPSLHEAIADLEPIDIRSGAYTAVSAAGALVTFYADGIGASLAAPMTLRGIELADRWLIEQRRRLQGYSGRLAEIEIQIVEQAMSTLQASKDRSTLPLDKAHEKGGLKL